MIVFLYNKTQSNELCSMVWNLLLLVDSIDLKKHIFIYGVFAKEFLIYAIKLTLSLIFSILLRNA